MPREPMGEGWFLSEERRMYPQLAGDLGELSALDLRQPLSEIASGTAAFGPREEWTRWYHYLLPRLLPRAHEAFVYPLIELLVSGFIALYPNGIRTAPYKRFSDDVLLTLGRVMMEPHCWNGQEIVVGTCLHRSNSNPNRIWEWWRASGDLSSSLFLCMKYLPEESVETWFRSVLAIQSSHWRAQLIVWLAGANETLAGRVSWPSEWKSRVPMEVDWDWSHCLRKELAMVEAQRAQAMQHFLPRANREKVLAVAREYFDQNRFLAWLESISGVSYLNDELGDIPSAFEKLYVRAR